MQMLIVIEHSTHGGRLVQVRSEGGVHITPIKEVMIAENPHHLNWMLREIQPTPVVVNLQGTKVVHNNLSNFTTPYNTI